MGWNHHRDDVLGLNASPSCQTCLVASMPLGCAMINCDDGRHNFTFSQQNPTQWWSWHFFWEICRYFMTLIYTGTNMTWQTYYKRQVWSTINKSARNWTGLHWLLPSQGHFLFLPRRLCREADGRQLESRQNLGKLWTWTRRVVNQRCGRRIVKVYYTDCMRFLIECWAWYRWDWRWSKCPLFLRQHVKDIKHHMILKKIRRCQTAGL